MTSFIDFLGITPFILIILGILLIVLQFYVEFESLGTLNKDRKNRQDEIITKYQEQKDKGEISLYGRIALCLELFFKSRILYKIGLILFCIGILLIIIIETII
ncbi:hypothetical protein [Aliarcobacter butzleri]|uniref:Uncharacterized protein n=1 Tax=bioreactor metagenome TaxID=1076179 RepID=A0A644THH5_9ZZZZ|nr:hypothetical protein [Aliarcobacter butzleri]QDM01355.1 hypothetical protein FM022_05870 [Aliarcobacter butzleri]